MKKDLILVPVTFCLLIPLFTPITRASGQPPIATTTFWEGNIGWGPSRADPVRVYDAGSGQLVFNSYETLIAGAQEIYYDFEPRLATNVPTAVKVTHAPVSNTSFVDPTDPDGSLWSAMECVGYNDLPLPTDLSVGDVMYMLEGGNYCAWYIEAIVGTYTITLARWTYTFTMRTSPVINFYDETGAVVDTFDVADAEYSFKRGLVQDQLSSPQWMFYKPMFGTMNSNLFDSVTDSPTAMTLANLIDDAIVASGNDLIFSLGIPFPDNAWKQILTKTWGSIVSKQFSISIGCWNGDLLTDTNGNGYPDWWDSGLVRRKSRSPYDATGAYRWVGTGPYHIAVFDSANLKVDMLKNPGYWRGWPATGRNGSLDVVEIQYIADWTTRKAAFQAGDIDTCAVPRANMFELLDVVTKDPPVGVSYKTIKNILPGLTMDAIHPTFDIDPTSYYIGTGHFPDGIPTDFFNNTHIRKAFAYSFNSTQYGIESYHGEADYRKNFLAAGLYPDYYNDSVPGYTANLTAAKLELQAATFPGVTGSVWDTGFRLTLVYNTGNDMRRIACEMIRDFFGNLSTYGGRVGNPFTVNIANIDWEVYLEQLAAGELPIWSIGWHADFADADNFARSYMHSNGDYSYVQGYTAANGWGDTKDLLIDQALVTADGPATARQGLYQQLQLIYYMDCPSYPVTIPRERRWCQYWVRGWYYNAVYPGDYYGCMYKEDVPWEDVTGAKAGVPDGRVNIFDLSYVLEHYGARAPVPGWPIDPKWVGAYGNGCPDVYSDRIVVMKDVAAVISNYGRGFPQEQEHGGSVDLAVETSKKVVEINYDVTVAVKVKNVVNFTGYEMCLLYDGSLLEIESWTVEPIPGWNLKIYSNKSGSFGSQKYVVLDVLSGADFSQLSQFSGDATLVTLLFKGLAEGNVTLDISRSNLGVSDTGPLPTGITPMRGKIYNAINDVVSIVPYLYNIAIDNMTSKSVIGRGYCANISAALSNYCNHTLTLNVTAYCNTTNFVNLSAHVWDRSSTSTVLVWNTTGFAYGNYTIWAYAEPLPGEIDVKDNNCTCAVPVHVGVPGDISGPTVGVYDGTTNMRDINYMITLFNTYPSSSNWNPNADVNNDGTVNMRDIQIAILNFNKYE